MPITATRPVAGVAETLLCELSADAGPSDDTTRRFLLRNATGTASVFLGPAGVTAANGFEWAVADGPIEVELEPGEKLYGIVAAAAQTLHVLGQGR